MNEKNELAGIEGWLQSGPPVTAPAGLRGRVLADVHQELARVRRLQHERLAAAVAALLLFAAVAANAWVIRFGQRELTEFFGPALISRSLRQWTETVAEVTGPATAQRLQANLLLGSRKLQVDLQATQQHVRAIQRALGELESAEASAAASRASG